MLKSVLELELELWVVRLDQSRSVEKSDLYRFGLRVLCLRGEWPEHDGPWIIHQRVRCYLLGCLVPSSVLFFLHFNF